MLTEPWTILTNFPLWAQEQSDVLIATLCDRLAAELQRRGIDPTCALTACAAALRGRARRVANPDAPTTSARERAVELGTPANDLPPLPPQYRGRYFGPRA